MKTLVLTVTMCCCTLFLFHCKQSSPDPNMLKADKENLLKADMNWSDSAKEVDDFMAYVLDDANMLPPNEPMASGKEAIKTTFASMHDMSGFSVTWKPSMAEVANSGDLGYTIGTYKLSVNDSTGMPMADEGKYLTVWKKQADGSWKVAADMFNSNLPMH